MTHRIQIRDGAELTKVIAKNNVWVSKFEDGDRDRLSKEISDLVYHGQMMADQGAAFSSKRTLTFGDETVILDARFGLPSIWQRLLGMFGG